MQNVLLNLFIKLLGMSIEASLIAAAVIAMRLIFRRAPKWTHCVMWALVAIKLLCPFTLRSGLSVMPSENPIEQSIKNSITIVSQEGKTTDSFQDADTSSNGNQSEIFSVKDPTSPVAAQQYQSTSPGKNNGMTGISRDKPILSRTSLAVLTDVWLAGLLAVSIYSAICCAALYRKVSDAVLLRENIYLSDKVNCAFVLGLIKPKIYLPFGVSGENARQVIQHEKAHLRRRDNLTKPLAVALAAVYWFNPVILLCCILYCRDVELACDESVVRGKGIEQRKAYSRALLECSSKPCAISIQNPIPTAFGKTAVKRRVVNVLKNKKPAIWIICAALAASAAVGAVMLTRPKIYTKEIPDDLDQAVTMSVLEQNNASYTEVSPSDYSIDDLITDSNKRLFYGSGYFDMTDVECIGEGHKILGTKESGNKVEVYALCSSSGYGFINGYFVDKSGYSQIPTRFTFETNKDGSYKLIDVTEAQDGGLYEDSVYKMFPKSVADKVLGPNHEDFYKELKEQCDRCAKVYLKKIGRDAEVGSYSDFDFQILTDYGVSVEVSNAMIELHPNYDIYVGNFETIESGTRYIYSQTWSPEDNYTGNGTLTFMKCEYDTGKEIEKFSYKVEGKKFTQIY